MFWKKKSAPIDLDVYFTRKINKFQLFNRTRLACTDTTDYELRLKHFLENNQNNILLITRVVGYRQYLIKTGSTNLQAAKETLDYYQH